MSSHASAPIMSMTSILLQLAIAAVGLMVTYAYLLRLERRLAGGVVARGCPHWGPLWPLMDVLHTLFRRGEQPPGASRLAYIAGPWLLFLATFGAVAVVCLGAIFDTSAVPWPAPWNSLLAVVTLNCLALLGTAMRGWADGRPYVWSETQLAVGQALAYLVPALLALMGALTLGGSLELSRIVDAQIGQLPLAVYQPLGLVVSASALLMGGRRMPYRLPGCRDRLLSDFHLQHSDGGLALCHWAEYLHLFLASMLISLFYLAGWHGLWRDGLHWLLLKATLVALALLWVRDYWLEDLQRRARGRLWLLLTLVALGNALLTGVAVTWGR